MFRDGIPGWISAGYQPVVINKLPSAEIPTISTAELKRMLDKDTAFVLLDIRSQVDRKFSIEDPRLLFMDLNSLTDNWQKVPKGMKVVLIDHTGKRTQIAGLYLRGKGYEDVVKVAGGYMQWIKEGFPIVQK